MEAIDVIQKHTELIPIFRQAVTIIGHTAGDSIRRHIELGRLGLALSGRQEPMIPDLRPRRESMVEVIAMALDVNGTTFRRAMELVERFTPEQLDMFLNRRSVQGHAITVQHLDVLLEPMLHAHRLELIDYFYIQSATVEQLRRRAHRLTRPTYARGHTARPRGIAGAVKQVSQMADTFRQKLATDLDQVLFRRLQEFIDGTLLPEPNDYKLVTRLDDKLTTLRDVLNSTIATTSKAKAALAEQLEAATA
jgi:hypothetical protein